MEIPFNCNDVFRDENKEMKEGEREEGEEKRNEEKNEERGMELSAFGREQLGGKRKGTRLCAGSREGGLESVKKICQRTERGREKKGGKEKRILETGSII